MYCGSQKSILNFGNDRLGLRPTSPIHTHLPRAGDDTVPISVRRAGGVHYAESFLVVVSCLLSNKRCSPNLVAVDVR